METKEETLLKIVSLIDKNVIKTIESLLCSGADINTRNVNMQTPLLIALQNNCIETARCLIKSGADVNAEDNKGVRAMHLVAQTNNIELVKRGQG